MLVIQANLTLLLVGLIVAFTMAILWGWDRKRLLAGQKLVVQELHQDHAATLLKTQAWAKAMAEGHQHDLAGQSAVHTSVKRGLGLMIQALIPYALRQALLHDDDHGNRAARLVYIANCMGLVKADRDTAKQIARGQVYASLNPTELSRLVESLAVEGGLDTKPVTSKDACTNFQNILIRGAQMRDVIAKQPLAIVGQGTSQKVISE